MSPKLHRSLLKHGFSAVALHGDMDQRARTQGARGVPERRDHAAGRHRRRRARPRYSRRQPRLQFRRAASCRGLRPPHRPHRPRRPQRGRDHAGLERGWALDRRDRKADRPTNSVVGRARGCSRRCGGSARARPAPRACGTPGAPWSAASSAATRATAAPACAAAAIPFAATRATAAPARAAAAIPAAAACPAAGSDAARRPGTFGGERPSVPVARVHPASVAGQGNLSLKAGPAIYLRLRNENLPLIHIVGTRFRPRVVGVRAATKFCQGWGTALIRKDRRSRG